MRYLWTEDTGAGLHFWKLVNQLFFDNELAVESKGSNQGLLDAVLDLNIKEDDKYYIAFDYVVDNQDIRNKYRMLKSITDKSEGNATIDEDIEMFADIFFGKDGTEKFREVVQNIRNKNNTTDYAARTRAAITEMTPEAFARMIYFIPEDDLVVSYKPEKSKKYIPLSNASAGQKTTAILTFLLAYGNLPLLLDQPEDDLDNKLVYDLIVTRLKKTKSKRQIIVVTHNANIPVNGDAEYIISMDSDTDLIKTKYQGTMDDGNIRKEICDVMEGTQIAFEMRAKKYHFRIVE